MSSSHRTHFCEFGEGPYLGDDPAILIIVDTNDAGDRLKISRSQKLLGVPGQEDPIYHTSNSLEGLRKHSKSQSRVRS